MYNHTLVLPHPRSAVLSCEGKVSSLEDFSFLLCRAPTVNVAHPSSPCFQGVGNFVVLADFVLRVVFEEASLCEIITGGGVLSAESRGGGSRPFPPPRCLRLGLVRCTVSQSRHNGRHVPLLVGFVVGTERGGLCVRKRNSRTCRLMF